MGGTWVVESQQLRLALSLKGPRFGRGPVSPMILKPRAPSSASCLGTCAVRALSDP